MNIFIDILYDDVFVVAWHRMSRLLLLSDVSSRLLLGIPLLGLLHMEVS